MRAFYSAIANPPKQQPAVVPPPAQPTPPTSQGSNAIMEALANLTRQNNAPPAQPPAPPMAPVQAAPPSQAPAGLPGNLANLLSSLAQHTTPPQAQPPSYPPQNFQAPAAPQNPMAYPPYPAATAAPAYGTNGVGAYAAPPAPPAAPPAAAGDPQSSLGQQMMLIKALADQGIPFEQIPAFIQQMQAAGMSLGQSAPVGHSQQPYGATQPTWDQYQASNKVSSPERPPRRSRSRSPGRRWDGRQDQRGDHRPDDSRGGRGSEYRQRSPVGHRTGGDPMNPPAHRGEDKWVEYDRTLPEGTIRVFSRTLFVGGVT